MISSRSRPRRRPPSACAGKSAFFAVRSVPTPRRSDQKPASPCRGLVEPMECLPVAALPDGQGWFWELKLDGYRAIAVKSERTVRLYSRNGKPFDKNFSQIAEALDELADGTTVDGEVVAL